MTKVEQGLWLLLQIDLAIAGAPGEYVRLTRHIRFNIPTTTCVYRVMPDNLEAFRKRVNKSPAFKNTRKLMVQL